MTDVRKGLHSEMAGWKEKADAFDWIATYGLGTINFACRDLRFGEIELTEVHTPTELLAAVERAKEEQQK
jgi:hypothetical protein